MQTIIFLSIIALCVAFFGLGYMIRSYKHKYYRTKNIAYSLVICMAIILIIAVYTVTNYMMDYYVNAFFQMMLHN